MHSVTLLKAEIEKEEAALEQDELALQELETNAKAEHTMQQSQAKKVIHSSFLVFCNR